MALQKAVTVPKAYILQRVFLHPRSYKQNGRLSGSRASFVSVLLQVVRRITRTDTVCSRTQASISHRAKHRVQPSAAEALPDRGYSWRGHTYNSRTSPIAVNRQTYVEKRHVKLQLKHTARRLPGRFTELRPPTAAVWTARPHVQGWRHFWADDEPGRFHWKADGG